MPMFGGQRSISTQPPVAEPTSCSDQRGGLAIDMEKPTMASCGNREKKNGITIDCGKFTQTLCGVFGR